MPLQLQFGEPDVTAPPWLIASPSLAIAAT